MANTNKSKSIRILHVAPTFFPAVNFGGPIFSTKAICDELSKDPEIHLEVLTTNAAGHKKSQKLDLKNSAVTFPGGYSVRYCHRDLGVSVSLELLGRLPSHIYRASVIHLTGPYSFPVIPTLILCRILRKPVIWSPRGGFQATQQWNKSPKRLLKRIFERVANAIRSDDTVLHITAQMEKENSTERFPNIRTAIIPNSVTIPPMDQGRLWRPNGQLRLCFLSRIHEKKGLEDLITSMTKLPKHVVLDIFGNGEESYIEFLKEKCSELELTQRIRFCGHVDGEEKRIAFTSCDIFCLPTHSENFGIVIAEALAHGTPVLTTENAPWESINQIGCGLSIESGVNPIIEAILMLDKSELKEMGCKGRTWMETDYSEKIMGERFNLLYRSLAEQK